MAPVAEDVYFPLLEKCLKEQALLFTWKDVYTSIQDSESELSPGVQRFLDDAESLKLLKRPLQPFDAPSSGAKSKFDHLTAAIHITPDESATYSISEIKEDALWLSKEAKVDEVAALRVAVLEWQKRPALSLLARSLDAEEMIDDVEEADELNESIFIRSLSVQASITNGDSTKAQTAAQQRRSRLLLLFHSEKAYLLATSRLIFSTRTAAGARRMGFAILRSLGAELEVSCLPQGDGSTFIRQAVGALKASMDVADDSGELLDSLGDSQALRIQLNDLLLLDITSTFEMIILVAESSDKILSADAVQPFFQLMLDTGYFSPIIASALEGSPILGTILQLTISIAGLAILKLPAVLDFIAPDYENDDILRAPETRGYYICTSSCLKILQDAFRLFAENECSAAAFAMLAWVILTSSLHNFARTSGALEGDDDAETASSAILLQDHWRTDALNQGFLEVISGAKSLGEAISVIAQSATSALGVFQQMSAVISSLDQFYGEWTLKPFADSCQTLLFELFQQSQPLVQYSSETLGAFLSILGGNRSYWNLDDRESDTFDALCEFVAAGLQDNFKEYLDEIRYRYPREMGPFHQFVRALLLNSRLSEDRVQGLLEYVMQADSFMLKLPVGFHGYREDPSNTELGPDDIPYRLVADLPFFHSQRLGLDSFSLAITDGTTSEDEEHDQIETYLPSGSLGSLVVSGRPPVICFGKHFSPLRYMVGCLCTVIPGNDYVEVSTGASVSLDDISDILSLLSAMLLAAHKAGVTNLSILDETFLEAEPNRNLLEIIAELFESQLSAIQGSTEDGNVDILVQCVQFLHAVALTHPTRLWPILARSRLLEIDGRGGGLAAVVSSVEMVSGRYNFLISCIRLFEALVDASLWSGAAATENRALTRFSERRPLKTGAESLPQRMASVVMTSFTTTLREAFMNSRSWRYASGRDRSDISSKLAAVFDKVLHYVFGYDDEPDSHQKTVVAVLAEPANIISDLLLSLSASHSPASTIVDMLESVMQSIQAPTFAIFGKSLKQEARLAMQLCSTATSIRAARGAAPSVLEQQLYRASPIFARLFAGYEGFKSPVAGLIERLITAPTNSGAELPSLLGNLSPSSAKDFLIVLGHLDLAFEDIGTERDLWRMLSAVVSSRQQWFAISLLTGKIPKDRARLKANKEPPSRTVSLFSHAINQLSDVSLDEGRPVWQRLPPELALEMLQFVASCQNHWVWAVTELRSHPKFIDAISKNYIRHLHRESTDSTMSMTNEAAIAVTIAEILAMYLYSSLQLGDGEAADKIVDHLQYFERFGVVAPKYSTSLHNNLKSNLEKQHKGLRLENFKHTLTFPTHFGSNYVYDIPFASQVLNVRRSAKGKALRGLEQHLASVNEDLSFVDAQISLLRSWKLLAIELAKTVKPDTKLSSILIDVVRHSLEENAKSTVPQAIFEQLRYQRTDLALNLLQRLVVLDFKDSEQMQKLKDLSGVTWDTIRASGFDFEVVFAGSDVPYYRSLLQILFLTLKPLVKATPNASKDPAIHAPPQASVLIEVLVYIIIKGFKSLTNALHEDIARAVPSDFVLLTAMLQIILKIPGIDLLFSQFALHFANNNAGRHATSLFSWSDQFLLDGDPIYGELAILFLLEMSSIPSVAETLAVDGVLSQLASAKIMRLYTRAKGMGPFDNPSRLHSIWSRGILPLCLNLLDAVGAPIAAEVASFLNTFPSQLARLDTDLANRGSPVGTRPTDSHITLSLASETHSLALLWLIIERYRAAGAASGTLATDVPSLEWDKAGVKDNVDDFVMGRSSVGPLVVPANEREAELARLRPLGKDSNAVSRLEERIMAEFKAASECLKGDVELIG